MNRVTIIAISIMLGALQSYGLSDDSVGSTPQTTSMAASSTDRVDIVTQGGLVYTNCTIVRVEPDGITVATDNGIAKIGFAELSGEYRKKYGYDSEKAADYARASDQKKAAEMAAQPESEKRAPASAQYEVANKESLDDIKKLAIDLTGVVQQITKDGVFISETKMPAKYEEEVVKTGYTPTDKNRKFTTKIEYVSVNEDGSPVFIFGGGSGYTVSAGWSATAYPAGVYKYTTSAGDEKIVKCYTLSPEAALNRTTLRSE
jgi:hypothetical protein